MAVISLLFIYIQKKTCSIENSSLLIFVITDFFFLITHYFKNVTHGRIWTLAFSAKVVIKPLNVIYHLLSELSKHYCVVNSK